MLHLLTVTRAHLRRRLSPRLFGYGLALFSTAVVATTFVISKMALKVVNPESFSVVWYGAAGLYAALYGRRSSDASHLVVLRRRWKPLLALGLTNAVSALLWFSEIQMADPALVSFFGGMSTLFVVLLSVVVLGERLSWREGSSAAVILAGALLITYHADRIVLLVFIIAVGQTFLRASCNVIAKHTVSDVSPLALTMARAGGTAFIILIYALLAGRWRWPPPGTLALIVVGALGGPFFSYVLFYRALVLIDVSKASLIEANRPLFVLLYSLILFGSLPQPHQIAGGLLSVGGVVILLSTRQKR
jgi:drug/metabolite transporter (DMT)-like permease